MAKAKGKGLSKTTKWIIVSALVVGAGVGLFLILRKRKKDKETADETQTDTDTSVTDTSVTEKKEVKAYVPTPPAELNTKEKIKAFQEWLDIKYNCWYKDNASGKSKNICMKWAGCDRTMDDGKWCGSYGAQTEKMWKKFGAEYSKQLKLAESSTSSSKTSSTSLSSTPPKSLVGDNTTILAYNPYTYQPPSIFSKFEGIEYEPTSSFTSDDLDLNL